MYKIKSVKAIILYNFLWLISLLPFFILYLLSDFIFIIAYYIVGYRKKVVFENLKNSFPEKDEQWRKKTAKKFYRHFSDNLVETLKAISMSNEKLNKRFILKNPEILNNHDKKGQSYLLVSGHYGNWDWMAQLNDKINNKMFAVYLPPKNKSVEELLLKVRSRTGVTLYTIYNIIRAIFKHKQKGIATGTYMLIDQSPHKNKIQFWTTFLNQTTPVFIGVERIARKTNQAVFFIDIQKIKRGYYTAEAIPVCENPQETKDGEITIKYTKILEQKIIENPHLWLWSHRRWKYKKADDIKLNTIY